MVSKVSYDTTASSWAIPELTELFFGPTDVLFWYKAEGRFNELVERRRREGASNTVGCQFSFYQITKSKWVIGRAWMICMDRRNSDTRVMNGKPESESLEEVFTLKRVIS